MVIYAWYITWTKFGDNKNMFHSRKYNWTDIFYDMRQNIAFIPKYCRQRKRLGVYCFAQTLLARLNLASGSKLLPTNVSRHANHIFPVNSHSPSAAYMRQWTRSALVQIMACRLFGAKPLFKPMLFFFSIGPFWTNWSEIWIEMQNFSFTKMHLKMHLKVRNGGHFVQGEMS